MPILRFMFPSFDQVLALYGLIVAGRFGSLQDSFVRLACVILIVDGASHSCSRFRAEAETWQGFFRSGFTMETNELPQKSDLLEITNTPGANDQVKA